MTQRGPPGQQDDHQQRRQQPREKQLLDGEWLAHLHLLGDDAVKDERHRRHYQQAQTARGGYQPQAVALRITVRREHRQEQRPHRDDRHAGCAGERGENRTGDETDDREPGRHPSKQRLREVHQPLGSLRRHHDIAGESEKRQRHQERRVGDSVQLDGDNGQIDPCGVKPKHRRRHHDSEQRRAEKRHDHDSYGERHYHCRVSDASVCGARGRAVAMR